MVHTNLGKLIAEKFKITMPNRDEKKEEPALALEEWARDEAKFKKHFDLPYSDFCDLIEALTPSQHEKYNKILAVHTEAAILWAIHEGKSHGLLKEVPDEPPPTEPVTAG